MDASTAVVQKEKRIATIWFSSGVKDKSGKRDTTLYFSKSRWWVPCPLWALKWTKSKTGGNHLKKNLTTNSIFDSLDNPYNASLSPTETGKMLLLLISKPEATGFLMAKAPFKPRDRHLSFPSPPFQVTPPHHHTTKVGLDSVFERTLFYSSTHSLVVEALKELNAYTLTYTPHAEHQLPF